MIGTKIAHYEITAHLGSGGMGDVYQATDLKLKRSVAIKLLPAEFSSDAERLSRFRREAQLLASLNHPNIAHIYGLEESGDKRCIVMELVDGETLQAQLKRGPIPVGEALGIAKQICEALEAAHEKGVIHRDLKPGNVMLTGDGKVKVLDFGLAKAFERDASSANLSNSPTLMSGPSMPGVILGTAAYMSPEQARGKNVDKRTDIFAFGCVLFEMLTGKAAFDGEDVADILSRVLQREPDWSLLPASIPRRLRELLKLCLEKGVKNRRSDPADVRLDIDQTLKEMGAIGGTPKAVSSRSARFGWGVAAVLMVAFATLAAIHFTEKPSVVPEMRVEINTPSSSTPLEFALSPDGRNIVFVASGDGPKRLWLRPLDKTTAQPMSGTDEADFPFWSPDSRSIGFAASGKLKRIDIAGGPAQTVADAPTFRGGAWNTDGTILFAPSARGPLYRVSASGGEPVAVTKAPGLGAPSDRFPQFVSDGNHFLFYELGSQQTPGIYLGSLDGSDPKRLTTADAAASYLTAGNGTIVFMREGALLAQHLDLKRGELTGEPAVVADSVGRIEGYGAGGFSLSAAGPFAYRAGSGTMHQLSWYDRAGKALGTIGTPYSTSGSPELSPNGQRVAFDRTVQGNADIWFMDVAHGGTTRLTFDPAQDSSPAWSPDGLHIAFTSRRKGVDNLYVKPSSGIGAEDLILETPNRKVLQDWSRDDRFLLYMESGAKTSWDLWALPLTGADKGKPLPIATTAFDEEDGQFSPDGHWVAYRTTESGRPEVVVQPFPAASGKWQVSTNGGSQPRWREDGKELYFIGLDGEMMAASITTSGGVFAATTPMALFPTQVEVGDNISKAQYAVAHDGRFLLSEPTDSSRRAPITLILNWKPPSK